MLLTVVLLTPQATSLPVMRHAIVWRSKPSSFEVTILPGGANQSEVTSNLVYRPHSRRD